MWIKLGYWKFNSWQIDHLKGLQLLGTWTLMKQTQAASIASTKAIHASPSNFVLSGLHGDLMEGNQSHYIECKVELPAKKNVKLPKSLWLSSTPSLWIRAVPGFLCRDRQTPVPCSIPLICRLVLPFHQIA